MQAKQEALSIIKAKRQDMPKVAEIISSSAEWYEPIVDQKDMAEHQVDERWIEQNYKRREFYIGKAECGSEVGTISLQHFDNITYLGYIYLDTNHVGKGFGHQLMDFAKQKSKQAGQDALVLIAHPEATWAVKAYKKFGFQKVFESKENVLSYKDGLLEPYYEEGFHLYRYPLSQAG